VSLHAILSADGVWCMEHERSQCPSHECCAHAMSTELLLSIDVHHGRRDGVFRPVCVSAFDLRSPGVDCMK